VFDGDIRVANVGGMEAEAVLAEATEAYRAALGDRFMAAYALGSLAHGGFSALVSDIDLGLILSDPLRSGDAETIEAIAEEEKAKGSALHQRLSVFWGTRSTLRGERPGGRFPPHDRLDLLENGRLLHDTDEARHGLVAPSRRDLLVSGAEFALDHLAGVGATAALPAQGPGSVRPAATDALEQIRSPSVLLSRGVRRVTKLVLFPVRFVFTAATGQVGINAAAVARHLADDRAPSKPLVAAAHAWRTAPPADQAGAADLLQAQMISLYTYYIDDHITRLRAASEPELAGAFRAWRERLVS
jgi:predicted nucleotidyltransferase